MSQSISLKASRHAKGPIRGQDSPPGFVAPFGSVVIRELVVDLEVDGPIVPGQPITFFWKASTFSIATPLDLGTVTFTLFVVDQYGNVDTGAPLYSATLSKSDSAAVTPGDFQSNKYSVQPIADLAQRLYRIGTQVLRLVVSGTGQDGPYESNDAGLVVNGEPVDGSWWQWDVPSSRNVEWKVDKYPVQGEVLNRSKYALINCTATMLETNLTDGDGTPKQLGADQPNAPVASGQHAAISFGMIDFSKSWPWYITGIFVPTGTIERLYAYQVRLDITDQFHNPYQIETSEVLVDVRVSDKKIAACSTACGLMAGALVELVAAAALACTPAGPILTAIAVGMAGAAQGIGVAANDPPVPDPRYRDLFEPRSVALPDNDDLAGILAALRSVFAIGAAVEAQDETNSRIVGAQQARDGRAERLQRAHFARLCEDMRKEAQRLRRLTPMAGKFLADHTRFTPAVVQATLWKLQRDPSLLARTRNAFLSSGGSEDSFTSLVGLLYAPFAIDRISNPSVVMMWIGRWAERLALASAKETAANVKPKGARR